MTTQTAISSSSDTLGGEPVFSGTRVPVKTLMDYLEAGDRIDDFLADFPTVRREQVIEVLALARQSLMTHANPA